MKKKKLKLNDLKVSSFTTTTEGKAIKGGNVSTGCETMECNTRDFCGTLLQGNDVGLCNTPTKHCPTAGFC